MKKLIFAAALLSSSAVMAAGDSWTMTGVIAAYPGTVVNEPFSAPIVNPTVYKTQHDCEAAITKIASTQPLISMIVNGNVLPAEKAQAGYVGIVASCN